MKQKHLKNESLNPEIFYLIPQKFREKKEKRKMKRGINSKFESLVIVSRLRLLHLLMGLGFFYFFLMTTQFPVLFRFLENHQLPNENRFGFIHETPRRKNTPEILSNMVFGIRNTDNSSIYKAAMQAWKVGSELWAHQVLETAVGPRPRNEKEVPELRFPCPEKVSVTGAESTGFKGVLRLPCGLTLGSHVTVVGQPRKAHKEKEPRISLGKDVMVAQFMVELRGERGVPLRPRGVEEGEEEAGRLLHFNPRIKGDWSEKPVIEMNHCYRGQWGTAVRCEGWRSPPTHETVDSQVKCEKWIRNDPSHFEESRTSLWLGRLMGQRKEVEFDWPYPFAEEKLFVLTITTGLEGYHISVNGRHITSFAYRNGFDLEDAMILHLYGDVDVHSIFAASLPTSHPSVAPERHLEMSSEWKARPLPHDIVDLFIGVVSAGDHFAERMAVRKSWMQHYLIKSSIAVARFFVALHERETINVELRKEAEYFGDVIIVPYLDNYDLVVLKTLAICEYGVNMLLTKYIMKCDDDTFVRIDAVIKEARQVNSEKGLYAGKLNYYHKPLRNGKWAVSYEEWPGEMYPPYADGPGYVISSDIARFIVTQFQKNRLRLFKMEDVSMGMWVEQFNSSAPVEYLHNSHFHQSGCIDDYYTAHYQSPKQLICLWERLQSEGKAICCNL